MLWIINLHGTPHSDRWLVTIILANAACNALYVGTPYNGNFANSTLVRGQYQSIAENRYGGLEKGLNDGSFSGLHDLNNQITSGGLLDNDLTSGMHNIDSYYSLQNKYLGQFSTSLQNTQYQANVPLRQVDDRTVLNNFFGVKYLFVQSNSENANKIPGGYFLDVTEPKINYDVGQPTTRPIRRSWFQPRLIAIGRIMPFRCFIGRIPTSAKKPTRSCRHCQGTCPGQWGYGQL